MNIKIMKRAGLRNLVVSACIGVLFYSSGALGADLLRYPDNPEVDALIAPAKKVNKVKIGMPAGWEYQDPQPADKDAWITARFKHNDLGATLLVFKFKKFLPRISQEQFMKSSVEGAMPVHCVVIGPYKLGKSAKLSPLFVGYDGEQFADGQEVTIRALTAYNIGQGFNVFGLIAIAPPSEELVTHFIAIMKSM